MTTAKSRSLSSIAGRGVVKTMFGQGSKIGLQLLTIWALAQLLEPRDFGLVLIVMALIGLADIFRDFGLSTAAVQAKTLSTAQRSNLWWANVGLGALLMVLLMLCAPALAAFNKTPAVVGVAIGLAPMFLLNGLATQYRADLNRSLRFGALASVEVAAQVIGSATGITLAYLGFGVWSLVWLQLAITGASYLLLLAVGRWWPGWPQRGVGTRALIRFGASLMGSQAIGYVGNNTEKFLVGRFFGVTDAGIYDRASTLLNRPLTQLRGPTTSVALPVLAKLQTDTKAFGAFVVSGQIGLGYTLVPGLALAAAAATPIADLVLGEKYPGANDLLVAIAFAGITTTLSYVGYWVFVSQGLTNQLMKWTLWTSLIRIGLILASAPFGLLAMAWATAAMPFVAAPLSLIWLGRLTPLPVSTLVNGYFRILAIATVAGGLGWLACTQVTTYLPNALGQATVAIVVTVLVYVMALAIPAYRADARAIVGLKNTLKNR